MRTLTRILEHFSVDLPLARARRQYGDRCGRSRSPSQSDGGDPAAIPNTRSREATQGKSLKNALGRTALPDEAHISTTVFNRRVLLTGEVPGETEKQKAESMVREIANVGGIVNELA